MSSSTTSTPNLPSVLVIHRGLVIYEKKILILRRSPTELFSPSLWEFPGGKLDVGETLHDSLLRETKEETNLDVEIVKPGLLIHNNIPAEGKYKSVLIITILSLVESVSTKVKISQEHLDFLWVEFSKLPQIEFADTTKPLISELLRDRFIQDTFLR